MARYLWVLALLLVSACQTAQVQRTCAEAQNIVEASQPFLFAAPPEIRVAITILGAGTVGCQTPEYAALRDRAIAWLSGHYGIYWR